MGDAAKFAVVSSGKYGILPNGKFAIFNAAGSACDCCTAVCAGNAGKNFSGTITDFDSPPSDTTVTRSGSGTTFDITTSEPGAWSCVLKGTDKMWPELEAYSVFTATLKSTLYDLSSSSAGGTLKWSWVIYGTHTGSIQFLQTLSDGSAVGGFPGLSTSTVNSLDDGTQRTYTLIIDYAAGTATFAIDGSTLKQKTFTPTAAVCSEVYYMDFAFNTPFGAAFDGGINQMQAVEMTGVWS